MSLNKSLYKKGYHQWMRQVNGTFVDMVPFKSKRKPAGKGWVDLTPALLACCDKPSKPTIDPVAITAVTDGDVFNLLTEGSATSAGGYSLSIFDPQNGETTNGDFTYTITEDGTLTVTIVNATSVDSASFILTDGFNYVPFTVEITAA